MNKKRHIEQGTLLYCLVLSSFSRLLETLSVDVNPFVRFVISLGPLLDYLNDEKYKEKDRLNKKTIKSRFKGFNDDFESLFKTQSAFYIPDDDLRELMRKDLRQRLLPPYRSFLDRYVLTLTRS
jgi:hypothetical protein